MGVGCSVIVVDSFWIAPCSKVSVDDSSTFKEEFESSGKEYLGNNKLKGENVSREAKEKDYVPPSTSIQCYCRRSMNAL